MLASRVGHNHELGPGIQWALSLLSFSQHMEGRGWQVAWGLVWASSLLAPWMVVSGGLNSTVIPTFVYSWMLCIPSPPPPSHQKRVFETVRNINQVVKQRSLTPSPMNIPGSNQSSAVNSLLSSCVSTPRSSFYGSDVGNVVLDNKTNSIILEAESADLG